MVSDNVKGLRDHPPGRAAAKQRIRDTIRRVAERHGYQPLETPIIEDRSILTSKFAGGEEILKEMYTLTDNGERDLGLRYDLTVPFARFVAEHPELKKPFKRYQSGQVYRDGPIKHGRYREFEQYDIDIVGSQNRLYDAELITIIDKVLSALDIPHVIEVNTRSLLTGVIEHVGIPGSRADDVILTIDKYEKIGRGGVAEELEDKGIEDDTVTELLTVLDKSGGNEELLEHYSSYADIDDFSTVHDHLAASNVDYEVNPYLARGLTYYTGTVFEAFTTTEFDRSIAAGGRYDSMISHLSDHDDDLPGVGASFGVDTLVDCVSTDASTYQDALFIIPMMEAAEVVPRAETIREQGVNVMVGDPDRQFGKNMDYADKEGFGYLLVIGDEERRSESYTVKNMETGDETTVSLDEVGQAITDL